MGRKLLQFRVYPESIHGFYFHCLIYPTRKAMYRGVRSRGSNADDGPRAMVQHIRVIHSNGHHSKQLGYINLCVGDLDAEVLSHESTHAALNWAEQMKINISDRTAGANALEMSPDCGEERFAYALGRICAQMADACWKHQLVGASAK